MVGQTHRRGCSTSVRRCSTSVRRCRSSGSRGCSSGGRGKAGQRRMDLLNLFETFLGEFRSAGKASIGGVVNTTRKKGDNRGGTIREISGIKSGTTVLLVIIINIIKPKGDRSNALEFLRQREGRATRDRPA